MHESHETKLKEESAQIRPNPPDPPKPRPKKPCPQVLFCETEGKTASPGYLHIEVELRCFARNKRPRQSTCGFHAKTQSRKETQRRHFHALRVFRGSF